MNQTVIDVYLHLRGEQPDRRRLPALPPVGSYIVGNEGRLWRVEAVAIDGQSIHVYATEVSNSLADELQAAWSAWTPWTNGPCTSDPDDCTCPRCAKARIARRPSKPKRPKQCEICGESSVIRPCPVCAALKAKIGRLDGAP